MRIVSACLFHDGYTKDDMRWGFESRARYRVAMCLQSSRAVCGLIARNPRSRQMSQEITNRGRGLVPLVEEKVFDVVMFFQFDGCRIGLSAD